ncbi:MAG: zinc ribbon domain-containing protein [Dehalococcoidia bacterium]
MSEQPEKTGCACPYCEEETAPEASHFCKPCQVTLRRCVKCLAVVEEGVTVCPKCGQTLE